jgi:site-specific DNA-methyltransferase (cytosine-N4-specific)
VLLGLCGPGELKSLERLQIGNREISPSERKRAEETIETTLSELPKEIRQFVQKLMTLLKTSEAGFRKRNTPALLAQYFTDMKAVLAANYRLLKSNGRAFWLVGPNKTQLNHKWLQIDTPRWLATVAESVGFSASMSPLDTYQRFGLHQRNGIREEFLLTLERN